LLTTALLNIVSNLLRFRTKRTETGQKQDKPIVIVVEGKSLSLPASDSAQKALLQKVEGKPATLQKKMGKRLPRSQSRRKFLKARKPNRRKRKR
jgi:hypothetical protein